MRVLVVDQDSASNLAIARSLRDRYSVDAVTNKADCLDLLRANTFEVIVAGERLEDGSGLELLGQLAKKYPSVLRIFAADRQRLKLLKGRLGPFELFQTLAYPIDPERLIATLTLADAAQDANADTSNIQHVVLSGTLEAEEPEAFPAPQPEPRAAPQSQPETAEAAARPAAVGEGTTAKARPAAAQRPRRASTASSSPPQFLGSGTIRPGAGGSLRSSAGNSSLRHGRRSVTNRAPPVRFPPLDASAKISSAAAAGRSDFAALRDSNSLAEAASLAREARSNLNEVPEELDFRRTTVMIATGALIVLGAIVVGFKFFGSKSAPPPQPAAQAVHAPEYPREVTDLLAKTESAFTTDDFKTAREDVDKLRQLAPSHPRLAFFESLLAQKDSAPKVATTDASHGGGSGRGSTKHNGRAPRNGEAAGDSSTSTGASQASAAAGGTAAHGSAAGSAATAGVGSRASAGSGSSTAGGSAAASAPSTGLPPETPPGMSRPASPTDALAQTGRPTTGSTAGSAAPGSTAPSPGAAVPSPGSAPASGRSAAPESAGAPTQTPASAPTQSASQPRSTPTPPPSSPDEPPPVIQEAKLIRRVSPEYPSAARHDGLEGSVDLDVTVSAQGNVTAASVVSSSPPDAFDKAAIAAVRKWKYDPRFVDGLPSVAHLQVHLDFRPGQ